VGKLAARTTYRVVETARLECWLSEDWSTRRSRPAPETPRCLVWNIR